MTGFDRTRNQNIALVWPVQNYLWFTLQFNIIWNLNKQKKKKQNMTAVCGEEAPEAEADKDFTFSRPHQIR